MLVTWRQQRLNLPSIFLHFVTLQWMAAQGLSNKMASDMVMQIALYNFQNGGCSKVSFTLFSPGSSDRTRDKIFKLYQRSFRLEIRKNFFSEIVVMHQSKLSRAAVEPLSLEVQEVCGCGRVTWFSVGMMVICQQLTQMFLEIFYNFNDSVMQKEGTS